MSQKFAVFDIDGTLIRWQLFHAVVSRLANQGALGDDFTADTKAARMRWKKRQDDTTFKDYEHTMIHRWLDEMNRVPYDAYLRVVDEVINEHIDQVYIYTRDLLKRLKSEGYFLLTISGSPTEVIARLADYYGFDDFIASEYHRGANGQFNGKITAPVKDKDACLKKLVAKHNLNWQDSVAVGDTASDISMLELVEKPIAFNPDRELANTAKQHGWPIVIERKSVVYELNPGEWNIS